MSNLKIAYVKFDNEKYNYSTSVNGRLKDEDIIFYFKGQFFNLGHIKDNMQKCIDCIIKPSNI